MKKIKDLPYLIAFSVFFPLSSYAAGEKKYETIAIGAFFGLAIIALVVFYIKWKVSSGSGDKFIYRQVEEIRNGRRIIVSKKFKIVDEKKPKRRPAVKA